MYYIQESYFIFTNRINVMFLTGGQENMMQNKHCTEIFKRTTTTPNERGMLQIYKNIWLSERGRHISMKRSHILYCWNDASFVIPNFLPFSTFHPNLPSLWSLNLIPKPTMKSYPFLKVLLWDYKTYTAKILILLPS